VGKTYNTVLIGTQCWLRENLGIGTMVNGSQNQTNNETIEKYCYNDSLVNCDTYGGLYQWDEAMQYDTAQGVRGICPPGWHIPTLAEFQTLSSTVGGDGNALKAIGEGTGGGAGTNTSGFSVLLAGYRNGIGYFYYLGLNGYSWSSTQYDASSAHYLYLLGYDAHIYLNGYFKTYGFSVRCLKDEAPNLPPNAPSHPVPDSGGINVWTSPTLRWSCSDPEADPLTYDVYFGTDNPPATLVSSNQGDTSYAPAGLSRGTTYYWKVVAKDDQAHSTAGPVWRFATLAGGGSPCPGTPTVVYAGKTYNTVEIGTQCWLRENLDVGTMVPGSQDQTNNSTIEKYCYADDTANCTTCGGLYQWDEAMQYVTTPGTRGICPSGWHIPTLAEFQTLSSTVSDNGNALKEIGQGSGSGAGTNTSGFSALLAGRRNHYAGFGGLGEEGGFYSSTLDVSLAPRQLYLASNGSWILLYSGIKTYGYSVRCLED
jgi:uncharacterized protein (TIGR02145 family)